MADVSQYLASTGQSIADPLVVIWGEFIRLIPSLFAALLIMLVGYLLAILLEVIITKGLRKVGLDDFMSRYNLSDQKKEHPMSAICGKIIFWYIIIIFLNSAVKNIKIDGLSDLLGRFTTWLPNLLIAAVIFIGGVVLAQMLYNRMVLTPGKKSEKPSLVASAAKGIVILFMTLVAIGQLGLRVEMVEETWLVIVGAASLAFAIGLGISLGSALKAPMRRMVGRLGRK